MCYKLALFNNTYRVYVKPDCTSLELCCLLKVLLERFRQLPTLRPFWGHLETILRPSWGHLETILRPSWGHLETILRPSWDHLRLCLHYSNNGHIHQYTLKNTKELYFRCYHILNKTNYTVAAISSTKVKCYSICTQIKLPFHASIISSMFPDDCGGCPVSIHCTSHWSKIELFQWTKGKMIH